MTARDAATIGGNARAGTATIAAVGITRRAADATRWAFGVVIACSARDRKCTCGPPTPTLLSGGFERRPDALSEARSAAMLAAVKLIDRERRVNA